MFLKIQAAFLLLNERGDKFRQDGRQRRAKRGRGELIGEGKWVRFNAERASGAATPIQTKLKMGKQS